MKCRHCGADLSLQLVDLGTAPPSNAFRYTPDKPETYYPLKVMACEQCWLVQTDTGKFPLNYDELFTNDYPYFSSTSKSWVEHAKSYVAMATERFALNEKSLTVEIGSNDGYLLQHVKTPCYGVEPTRTGEKAIKKGIKSLNRFFTSKFAELSGDQADLMIANNVLAHVPDINDFVRGFSIMLKPTGVATFEFPHLWNLIQQNQFDTIYHEHYSYLSLTAVKNIFEANGLSIFDVERLPTHGGSLRVFAQRKDASMAWCTSAAVTNELRLEKELGICNPQTYIDFQERANETKNNFLHFLLMEKQRGNEVIAFGAAAKGNTLLNYAGIRSDLISYIVDETPSKQGKYLPGSRIPVVKEIVGTPKYVVILPWNFRHEIMQKLLYVREWQGKFVVAIPYLQIL